MASKLQKERRNLLALIDAQTKHIKRLERQLQDKQAKKKDSNNTTQKTNLT